jgi:hypothetical protein
MGLILEAVNGNIIKALITLAAIWKWLFRRPVQWAKLPYKERE